MPDTYTKLIYHVIFSTKNRLPLIPTAGKRDLCSYMGGIVRNCGGALLEADGTLDHVHLLLKLPPTHALSDVIGKVKANASKWMNEQPGRLRKFGWQDGYAAFTVSQSQIARVSKYIQAQERHHRRADYREELAELLRRHGIDLAELDRGV